MSIVMNDNLSISYFSFDSDSSLPSGSQLGVDSHNILISEFRDLDICAIVHQKDDKIHYINRYSLQIILSGFS